jgi:tRNA(fMet)-specific endonuclease VapC
MLIAAIAMTHRLTVVTHNTRELARIDGLKLEEWEVKSGSDSN